MFGPNQEGEVMKKNTPSRRSLGDMRDRTLILIMIWMLFMIGMATIASTTTMIINLTGLLGLGNMTVMIMHMMIMTISHVLPIRNGGIAVRGIMNMVTVVMILIMKEAAGEMAIGGGVNPMIENVIREL
jgi:hypothetical protein